MKTNAMKYLTLLLALTLSSGAWALPPQIEADRLAMQGKTALDAGDYDTAVQSFERMAALNIKVPDSFYYHSGRAYSGVKKWDKARAAYEKYLNQAGTRGKYYPEALAGFNKADVEWTKAEKAYSEAMNSYMQAQSRYEDNMRNCPKEYEQYRQELEARKERAWQKCQDYRNYGCVPWAGPGYKDPTAQALLQEAESLDRRVAALSWNHSEWCNNRYSAPRKP